MTHLKVTSKNERQPGGRLPSELDSHINSFLSPIDRRGLHIQPQLPLDPTNINIHGNVTDGVYGTARYQNKSRTNVRNKAEIENPELKYLRLYREMYGNTDGWSDMPQDISRTDQQHLQMLRRRDENYKLHGNHGSGLEMSNTRGYINPKYVRITRGGNICRRL